MGFRHYEHSLRVVDHLERDGAGLNLTEQVRDGIARHSEPSAAAETLEGRIVRLIDRVAYINHDIDDAVRAGLLREQELPAEPIAVLGDERLAADRRARARHGRALRAARATSSRASGRRGDERAAGVHVRARLSGPGAVRAEHAKIAGVVRRLFEHYVEHPELLPPTAAGARCGERSWRSA